MNLMWSGAFEFLFMFSQNAESLEKHMKKQRS